MKHLRWLLCVLLVTNTVSAQESSAPSTPKPAATALAPLVIEVRAQRVSKSALSEALSKELHQGATAERPTGELELSDSASNTVRLSYRDATGRETTRDLFLEPDDPEALEKITIAAANLVRDQMGALSQLEAAQRAEEAAALAALATQATPAPPSTTQSEAPPAKVVYDPCQPELTIPFGVDLAWLIGTSSTPYGRRAVRRISIGLAGTYSAGTNGFEASIFANFDRRGTCGAQLAAGFNLTFGDVRGAQLAVANLSLGQVSGLQLGVTNFALEGVRGVQLGVMNLSLSPANLQLGVVNYAGKDRAVASDDKPGIGDDGGTQLGVLNVSHGRSRAQLGVTNITTGYARSQLGVVNYAGRSRAPLGLLSIVRDGHTTLDAWANENGALYGMLTHGGDRIYNLFGVGTRVQKDGSRLALAIGIGARMYSDPHFSLDLQTLYELYPMVSPWRMRSEVARLRLAVDIKVSERFSLVPAVGYAIMITEYLNEPVQAPFGETEFRAVRYEDGERHAGVYGFPSFGLGLRMTLSNPKKPRE